MHLLANSETLPRDESAEHAVGRQLRRTDVRNQRADGNGRVVTKAVHPHGAAHRLSQQVLPFLFRIRTGGSEAGDGHTNDRWVQLA